jgi:hypothetical protein
MQLVTELERDLQIANIIVKVNTNSWTIYFFGRILSTVVFVVTCDHSRGLRLVAVFLYYTVVSKNMLDFFRFLCYSSRSYIFFPNSASVYLFLNSKNRILLLFPMLRVLVLYMMILSQCSLFFMGFRMTEWEATFVEGYD